ncbi:MAG: hypothetical protein J6023_02225, partial [Clostridia bacterium]|nr:hypothetical protein [Clostridia bacterium]
MELKQKIARVNGTPCAPSMERIKHEINYANAVNAVKGGIYTSLIDEAVSSLLAQIDRDGCITVKAAKACEKMLSPMEQDAKSYTVHFTGHA